MNLSHYSVISAPRGIVFTNGLGDRFVSTDGGHCYWFPTEGHWFTLSTEELEGHGPFEKLDQTFSLEFK